MFEIKPVPPFRLDLIAWAFKRRQVDQLYDWDGKTFRRAVDINGSPVLLSLHQSGDAAAPTLVGTAAGGLSDKRMKSDCERLARKMFNTDLDLSDFYQVAARSKSIAALAKHFLGLKPPRYPSVFEAFVNAIACQQVTLHVGLMILNRICETFGNAAGDGHFTFPTPQAIARTSAEKLMALGLSRNKASYILDMATNISEGTIDLEGRDALPNDRLLESLLSIRGIGQWSADYMMLRGYGRLDVFPLGDAGARNRLMDFLGLKKGEASIEELERYVRQWRSYKGLLYFHLLLHGLESKGFLQ